jgi:uncharacterized membrane protein
MSFSPVLVFHISAGTVGLLSGTAAMSFSKGSRRHRAAGNVFVIAMLSLGASGAYLGFMKHQMLNGLQGVLTLYLMATAWLTARRRDGEVGIFDWSALMVPLAVGAALLSYGLIAANSQTGARDGFPAMAYFIFGSVALLFAAGDVRMLVRGGVSGAQRIARQRTRNSQKIINSSGRKAGIKSRFVLRNAAGNTWGSSRAKRWRGKRSKKSNETRKQEASTV